MITYNTELTQGIDWLQFTSASYDWPVPWDNEYQDAGHGRWGYTQMRTWRDGRVKLWNTDRPEMFRHFQLSASALERVNSDYGVTPWDLLASIPPESKVTRIDVCIDAMRGNLDFDDLERQFSNRKVKTRAKTATRFHAIGGRGDTMYIGDAASPKRLRIYDKSAEQRLEGVQWTRIELQLRKPYANIARHEIVAAPGNEAVIPGLISGFASFPDCQDWRRIFQNAPIFIKSPEVERNATTEWLMKVVAPSLARHQFKNPQFPILDNFMAAYREEYKQLTSPID